MRVVKEHQMRVVKTLSIAFVVVCACSAMAAASASAADLFLASANGLKLLASADTTQTFKFDERELKCTKIAAHGVTAVRSLSQEATVLYTGCSTPLGGKVDEPIAALYLFLANNTVDILKPILIFVLELPLVKECHVTVEAQNGLGTITYNNNASGDILLLANVTGIRSTGLGAGCTYSLQTNGTYEGNSLVFVDGGTISWDE